MIEAPRCAASTRGRYALLIGWLSLSSSILLGAASQHSWFPPLQSRVELDGSVVVEPWGRQYRFTRGPLPAEVFSQGEQMFAVPPRFSLDVAGGVVPLTWEAPTVVGSSPERIVLDSSARIPQGKLTAKTTIEDDGMIKVDLKLEADSAIHVESYGYEIALPPAIGEFFNHHVEYDYRRYNVDKGGMIRAAGRFPPAPRRFPFVPTIFAGNRDVGVEWWSETDAQWSRRRGQLPITLDPSGGLRRLRVQPIQAGLDLPPGGAWTDTFALFPTPMRPPDPRSRSVRLLPWTMAAKFDKKAGTRFAWVATGAAFQARWHGLPDSRRNAAQRKLRTRLAQAGVAYIPYGKLTVAPTMHPESLARFDDWSADGKWWRHSPGDEQAVMDANGTRPPAHGGRTYAVCMQRRDYLDWLLADVLGALETEDLDGLYFDHGAITRMCRRNPALKGKSDRQVWEYFNVRDFYRRLFEEMKARDPESLLVIHAHGQPRALAAYVDFMFVGEAWNEVFRGGHSWAEVTRSPTLYTPDYFSLPEGYLEAMVLPRIGGAIGILPQVKPALEPERPQRARRYQRGLMALALPADVPVWIANADNEALGEIYRAIDRFGGLGGATFHPWWKADSPIRTSDPQLRASLYSKGGRGLLIVANWGAAPVRATITLAEDALGLASDWRGRDAERPQRPVTRGDPERPALQLEVEAHDFRLVLLD